MSFIIPSYIKIDFKFQKIAGNAVKRATDSLVKAAQTMNNTWITDDTDFSVDLRMVGGQY